MKILFLLLALLLPQAGFCDAVTDALAACRHLYRETDAKRGALYARNREAAAAAKQGHAYVSVSGTGDFIYSIEGDSFEKTTLTAIEFSAKQGLAPGGLGGQDFLVLKVSSTDKGVQANVGISDCHGRYIFGTRDEITGAIRFFRGTVKCCL